MVLYCKDQHAPLDFLRLGNLLYVQNVESLGNISTKLELSVMIGRCFSIIELMLEPSGLYCVVNITGFVF